MSNIAAQLQENSILKDRSTVDMFKLPCGYWDEETQQLHQDVVLNEIRGTEEDILANNKVPFAKRVDLVFASCITTLGTLDPAKIPGVIPYLAMGDRNYLLYALRRRSLGDMFPTEEPCPSPGCNSNHLYQFDLSQLTLMPMPNPEKRIYQETLPSGGAVSFHPMRGVDERRRDEFQGILQRRSLSIFLRLDDLNGIPATPEDVKNLTLRDRDYLHGRFAAVEGGVETSLELKCKSCGTVFERTVDPSDPGFFCPSETRVLYDRISSIS